MDWTIIIAAAMCAEPFCHSACLGAVIIIVTNAANLKIKFSFTVYNHHFCFKRNVMNCNRLCIAFHPTYADSELGKANFHTAFYFLHVKNLFLSRAEPNSYAKLSHYEGKIS